MSKRYIGIDMGAETIKVVELTREGADLRWTGRWLVEHHKEPAVRLLEVLRSLEWDSVQGASVSGRLSRAVRLSRVPVKQAQAEGYRHLFSDESATLVSIGSHGFSVLELRPSGVEVFRENSRCSQGTGNFLRQLVERFDLNIEQASELCATVDKPAPLSGRCPVILKTDMTHLANKGESRAQILAGLYDAVCENVQVLLKPRTSPPKVVLLGGVARAQRIRDNFRDFLGRHDMALDSTDADDGLYFEALGSAVAAAARPHETLPALEQLMDMGGEEEMERVPALGDALPRVKRMTRPPLPQPNGKVRDTILGFDIGSTGSKVVALDANSRELLWEGYLNTNGDPVGAAQALMKQFTLCKISHYPVVALGATGSGREVVGSLLSTCYGVDRVYVLNEIAAHAEGAMHYDPRVDTIFEIGGQDAKYIRLAEGRVVDAAMNEACSAGTGSFIEEQGRKFSGIEDVVQLGQEALGADHGISLGQHCSVFMAEIIDGAVACGEDQRAIIAGIYHSIIQNYLNRVKGSRDVGQFIFCQGMPFSADALAAAVAHQTGSEVIIPPNPGTVGALGIALLTRKGLTRADNPPLDPARFLGANLLKKDTFVCKSVQGCGGAGNKCRIDRLTTEVEGKRKRFTWGGGCSMYDKGTGKVKLPDLAPDPFREREELVAQVVRKVSDRPGRARVAMTDEFLLKSLFPFFASYVRDLGFAVEAHTGADQRALKRGIEEANIPFCAPMQQYHGLISNLAETSPDYILSPMLRSLPRVGDEGNAKVCPIVQGSADVLRWDLGKEAGAKIVSTVVDFGAGNLYSDAFISSCQRMAADLGVHDKALIRAALDNARGVQERFDVAVHEIGRKALAYCQENELTPVIILGRAYTIYNTVLNSNVPAIMREQGAIPIPVDCYPLGDDVPVFHDIYWGYGQRNLMAAHQVRRSPGQYSLFCSNYSCGPDSFIIHFYSYIMEGKPFAVIETDGHSGDAGTKTRVEAFLHCVREDLRGLGKETVPTSLKAIEEATNSLPEARENKEIILIPRMGVSAEALAAALGGLGIRAEALPQPNREAVRMGRRQTSGKECVPMTITTGSLLQRLERDRDTDQKFCLFMPRSSGPCRFGMYNVLHKIILERLEWKDRVKVWSPVDTNYFEGLPQGFVVLLLCSMMTMDMMLEALYDARPAEKEKGLADEIYERWKAKLVKMVEGQGKDGDLSLGAGLVEVATGRFYGCAPLLRDFCRELATVRTDKQLPRVVVVGEIYVRCDPFANDFTIRRLEERGIRCTFAPFSEWLEYADYINWKTGDANGPAAQMRTWVQNHVQRRCYNIAAREMGWGKRTSVKESVAAASRYISPDLHGEAVLTLGGPLHEWREGHIDGVVSVGPLECMPNKIDEAQFFHVAEEEGLPSLTLSLNGDPQDTEVLDNFAYEVHSQADRREQSHGEEREELKAGIRRMMAALTPPPMGRSIKGPIHVEDRTGAEAGAKTPLQGISSLMGGMPWRSGRRPPS